MIVHKGESDWTVRPFGVKGVKEAGRWALRKYYCSEKDTVHGINKGKTRFVVLSK